MQLPQGLGWACTAQFLNESNWKTGRGRCHQSRLSHISHRGNSKTGISPHPGKHFLQVDQTHPKNGQNHRPALAQWYTPVAPALGRVRPEDDFEVSLSYTVRPKLLGCLYSLERAVLDRSPPSLDYHHSWLWSHSISVLTARGRVTGALNGSPSQKGQGVL